ncbi:unnamed protein product, partial [Rotaria sordida]
NSFNVFLLISSIAKPHGIRTSYDE